MTITLTGTDRRQQAEQRLLVIRNALDIADKELAKAKANRDWEVFDLCSFEDYCAEMLPDLKFITLRAPRRQARIKALLAEDPDTTEREAAAATGSSAATAHRDFVKVTGRSASNEARLPARKTDRVVELIAAAGAAGLDVRAVQKALRCERHEASATLTRLHNAKRIEYVEPQRRGMFGRYVIESI